MSSSDPIFHDRMLSLGLARVAEQAALASARWSVAVMKKLPTRLPSTPCVSN